MKQLRLREEGTWKLREIRPGMSAGRIEINGNRSKNQISVKRPETFEGKKTKANS